MWFGSVKKMKLIDELKATEYLMTLWYDRFVCAHWRNVRELTKKGYKNAKCH